MIMIPTKKSKKTKRVYVKLMGGVGNQLFQYATARAASLRNQSELLFDARWFENPDGNRYYALKYFKIQGRVAQKSELPSKLKLKLGLGTKYIKEKGLGVNKVILDIQSNCYLKGYFQSEKYFKEFSNTIRKELELVHPPNEKNHKLIQKMKKENAVSLHFRRGDYQTSEHKKVYSGVNLSYYTNALHQIEELVGETTTYVFSDVPRWVTNNLKLEKPYFLVEHNNEEQSHEDLRLMATCKHNIIANSTFSLWGAWLNPNPKKIVFSPENFFNPEMPANPDIIPEGWKKLPN